MSIDYRTIFQNTHIPKQSDAVKCELHRNIIVYIPKAILSCTWIMFLYSLAINLNRFNSWRTLTKLCCETLLRNLSVSHQELLVIGYMSRGYDVGQDIIRYTVSHFIISCTFQCTKRFLVGGFSGTIDYHMLYSHIRTKAQ